MNSFLDPVELSLASKGLRFANYLIDTIVLYLVNLFMFQPVVLLLIIRTLQNDGVFDSQRVALAYFIYFVLYLIFFVLFMTLQEFLFKGRTIGKFVTGTKVVMQSGEIPTFKDYLIRSLCRCIPFEPFSFFGETGWHDSISKTRVVKTSDFMMNQIKFNSIDEIGKTTE